MSDLADLQEINRKLDTLIRLVAYQTVGEMKLTQGAPILRRIGLTASEIAAIYDSTANAVNVRLAEARKKKKDKAKRT
jgi:hypothetical protein